MKSLAPIIGMAMVSFGALGLVASLGALFYYNWPRSKNKSKTDKTPSPIPPELANALQELSEVPADAEEDGLEIPSDLAFNNAKRLLEAMYRISPRQYSIYPVSDGYIAIDTRSANVGITVVMCGSDGGVLCLATINKESRRARYSTASKLPDGFIREALLELGEEPSR